VIIHTRAAAGIEGGAEAWRYQPQGRRRDHSEGQSRSTSRATIFVLSICPFVSETPIAENSTVSRPARRRFFGTLRQHAFPRRNGKAGRGRRVRRFPGVNAAGFITGVAFQLTDGFMCRAFSSTGPRPRFVTLGKF